VDLSSSAQWIYFLRLTWFIFFGLLLVHSYTILPDAFPGQWIHLLW
jgi:hypothetical protein